ncbi:CdaR family transcriptional regulator [Clostridium sp. B9]|uniref:CdaR family transcriptional regulator n=1 Tax=Clostridium sp. B9 TaxID=3423224 RepID=UPI003D2F2F6D
MLDRELAQNIVNKMMEVIPYNVNIMNHEGIIIGSGDSSRIGTLHNGALEALRVRKVVEILNDEDKVKAGVNSPIIFRDKVIGVIGITGNPKNVRQFTQLVTVTAELLINQEYTLNKHIVKERLKEEFIYEWLYLKENYDGEFIQRGANVNIDISLDRIVAVLEFEKEDFKELIKKVKRFIKDDEYYINLTSNRIVMLLLDNSILEKRLRELKGIIRDTNSRVGLSTNHKVILKSMKEAVEAVDIGGKLYKNEIFHEYNKIKLFSILEDFICLEEWEDLRNRILKENMGQELLETFTTYMKLSGERKKTAETLHIHRNTLNYRLEKIEEITGLSFDSYLDLFQFMVTYIVNEIR